MREGDFYGAKETLLASGGKSYVQYTGNGCVYYPCLLYTSDAADE